MKNKNNKAVHVGFWAPPELVKQIEAFGKDHGGLSRSDICRLILGGFFSSTRKKPFRKDTMLYRGEPLSTKL